MNHSIPLLIHQTWSDSEIPDKWRGFQESWIRHHPQWEYRLWTDLELRQLIREHYPWFLSIYDHYAEPIQRVDAARYFLMHRYGGVYVDLDFECLRPLESLLKNQELVMGFEPEEHLTKPVVQSHGMSQVVGNAFLASRREHPFWEHVFLQLVGAHRLTGPLVTTGPFFLTRAIQSFPSRDSLACVPSSLLYPGTCDEAAKGLFRDPAWRAKSARNAYGIHHWSGSWFREDEPGKGRISLPLALLSRGKLVVEGNYVLDPIRDLAKPAPRVSCLMVTQSSRMGFVKRAVTCFQSQTYPSMELVIIDDGEGEELGVYLQSLADPRIVHVHLASESRALGALRNQAVAHATGEYVMQWDDDDLYHPRRIEAQMAALRAVGADACLLSRWKIWWPRQRRLATSKKRGWEGSILCWKEKLPRYDETLRRGEDTAPVLRLASREKVAFVDAPWLYTYVVHGENTTPEQRLEEHWMQASEFHWSKAYASEMRSLVFDLPEPVRAALMEEVDSRHVEGEEGTVSISTPFTHAPRVLILSPVKEGMPFIEGYFAGLQRLDYPASQLSLGILESDSTDGTFSTLSAKLDQLRNRFARAELFKRDYQFQLGEARAEPRKQLQRRSILARSRNYLLSRALRDEDWVLWLDFDVIDYPRDVIQQLLAKGREILVPHCVLAPGGRTFDLNTFIRSNAEREEDFPTEEPILQPPKGVGRKYLEEMRDRDLVEVDAVGGTMLLVKADLHREGLIFPVAPYRKYIETEGLSFLARDMGIRSWGAPGIEVIHANR